MPTRSCKVGVHGRNHEFFEDGDYQVIREARLEVVKMMSLTHPDVFQRLKQENPNLEIITRLHRDGFNTGGHPSVEEFANTMIPVMQRLQPFCTQFHVHNEPNHVARYEGWGNSDDDARNFNQWFLDVYGRLKQACPWASIGFPGLAVPDPLHRDRAWLQICRPAIERADWLGCHCYWQSPPGGGSVMLADHSGLAFKYYHEFYPNKLIHILECGNSNGQGQGFSTDPALYGSEYVTWLNEVFKYPYVASASFFILSSPDSTWDSFAWRTGGGIKQQIVSAIGGMARPALQAAQGQPGAGQPSGPSQPTQPAPSGILVGEISSIFSNQHMIDAFYNAAHSLGVGNWDILNKVGMDVAQRAQDRQALFHGPAISTWTALSDAERNLVKADLVVELRKVKRWQTNVQAPAGLNLRTEPSTEKDVLIRLADQTPLDVLHEQGDWLFVATSQGHAGYVNRNYVSQPGAPQLVEPAPASPPVVVTQSGATPRAQAGFLASQPELLNRPLAADVNQQMTLGPNAGPGAKLLSSIWNRYGGILSAVADQLDIDPALAVAIVAVESGGQGFGPDGRMLIRFENHLFYQNWGKQNQARFDQHFAFSRERSWEGHNWRADASQPFHEFHGNQAAEWQVLNFAASLDDTAAKLSISMGLPQIMGFNHRRIGYTSVQEMFLAFQADERNQLLGLFDFIKADANMLQALRDSNYVNFASGYNGTGQAQFYGGLIEKWVKSFKILQAAPAEAAFDISSAAAPALDEELDAAISFLPMPQTSALFVQVEQPTTGAPATATTTDQPPKPIMDQRLYDLWLKHIERGFENNNTMFQRVLHAFMIPYYLTVVFYCVMFLVGIGLFIAAVRLSVDEKTQLAGLFFGGLGAASFLGYFLSRPLRSLEENLQFITWLGIVYNSYWTRLLYMQDTKSVHADLKDATKDAVEQIEQMITKNVEFAGKRPDIKEPTTAAPAQG